MNKYFFQFFFFLFFNISFLTFGQVQWASKVLEFSAEYNHRNSLHQFRAEQALGKPNVMPQLTPSPCAWVAGIDNTVKSAFLKVGFEKAIMGKQIAIFENCNAGSISQVSVFDKFDKETIVYQRLRNDAVRLQGAVLRLSLSTPIEIAAVKLYLSNEDALGWSHIDAIGISSSETPIEAQINLPKEDLKPEIKSLGFVVNTPYEEILPIISPDGKILYFDRKNHPENAGEIDNDDIWHTSRNPDGTWKAPTRMGEPLNNGSHNYVCSTSPDGNLLLLGNKYLPNGTCEPGLSITTRIKGTDGKTTWSFPKDVPIKNYYNLNLYSEFALASNGEVLIYAIERQDTKGDRDLYVSFLQKDSTWSEPLHMGDSINSAHTEMTPFLASDGKTLYFSSRGFSGFGDADMYISKRLDDTWTRWSAPVNMGSAFNSPEWDASYSIDAAGEYAYFVSYKNSVNKSADIFVAKLPKEVKPDPVVLISGRVLNSKTKQPISAKIIYETLPDGKEAGKAQSDPETGEYKIVLPLHKLYGFWAKAEGFLPIDENIDLNTQTEYIEIQKDLLLSPMEVGGLVRLNNVFFAQAKDEMLAESYPELNRLVSLMTENPKLEIELEGHTDIEGNATANMKLSQKRVETIKRYLVEQGIAQRRIETKAFGAQRPMTKDRSEESKKLNRRVEFKILKF